MIGKLHKRKKFLHSTNPFIKKICLVLSICQAWNKLVNPVYNSEENGHRSCLIVLGRCNSCAPLLSLLSLINTIAVVQLWTGGNSVHLGSIAQTFTFHPQCASQGSETSWGVTQHFFMCTPENRQNTIGYCRPMRMEPWINEFLFNFQDRQLWDACYKWPSFLPSVWSLHTEFSHCGIYWSLSLECTCKEFIFPKISIQL